MKDLIIKRVSERLGLDEELINKVYMFQMEDIKKRMTDFDINIIHLPKLGNFEFRIWRGAERIVNLERLKRILQERIKEGKTKDYLDSVEETLLRLRMKTSKVDDKYEGVKTRKIDSKTKVYRKGVFTEFIKKLREQRHDRKFEDYPQVPKEDLDSQVGDFEGDVGVLH